MMDLLKVVPRVEDLLSLEAEELGSTQSVRGIFNRISATIVGRYAGITPNPR